MTAGQYIDPAKRFLIVWEAASHSLNYKAYKIVGNRDGSHIFESDTPAGVEEVQLATAMVDGSVKWDGCSEVAIDAGQLHFCGCADSDILGAVIASGYDLAATYVPAFDRQLAS